MDEIDLLENIDELSLARSLYEESFYDFFIAAWDILYPNRKLELNWHYKYICKVLQKEVERVAAGKKSKYDVIIINIPPRTLKSTLVSIMLNAWAWFKYPQLGFLTASYGSDLALRDAVATRRLIKSSWYQGLVGHRFSISEDQDTKSAFDNTRGGHRIAIGVGGSATGRGGDIITVDDPVDPQRANSEVERVKANKWWDETYWNRLNNSRVGIRIVVMQRLHVNDLTGHILAKAGEKYRVMHICLPAEQTNYISPAKLTKKYEKKKGLLFPKRLSFDDLKTFKKALGPYAYVGQMQQKPSPEGGGKLKRSWFPIMKANQFPSTLEKFTVTDAAEGKKNSDETATGVFSVYQKKLIVWELSGDQIGFEDFIGARNQYGEWQKRHFEKLLDRWGITGYETYNFIEDKSIARGIVDYSNAYNPYCKLIAYDPGRLSKEERILNNVPIFYSRSVILIDGYWNDDFLQQVEDFPASDYDDRLDVLAAALDRAELEEDNLTDEERKAQIKAELEEQGIEPKDHMIEEVMGGIEDGTF